MIADAPGWVQALVLGLVQGLTEFIPVSSSGHLVLVPALAGWERHGLAFDVALHLGTLLALLAYYRTDLWRMTRALTTRTPSPQRDDYRRLLLLLVIASLPVAVVGLTLGDVVESAFASPSMTAVSLLATAAVLIAGERFHRRYQDRSRTIPADHGDRSPSDPASPDRSSPDPGPDDPPPRIRLGQALTVGIAQSFALLPGISRSGLTISAGVAAGLSRSAATRFAFLLGLPAIAGAAIVQLPQVDDLGTVTAAELAVGVVAAAASGYLAIALLVRLVSRMGIDRFAWYLVPLAMVSLLILR